MARDSGERRGAKIGDPVDYYADGDLNPHRMYVVFVREDGACDLAMAPGGEVAREHVREDPNGLDDNLHHRWEHPRAKPVHYCWASMPCHGAMTACGLTGDVSSSSSTASVTCDACLAALKLPPFAPPTADGGAAP